MPMKIGVVNAIAAIGIVAKASAPPASMPEQRQVMTSWPPVEALAKNATGTMPQAAPSMKALRTSRCMARRETNCGFVIRRDSMGLQAERDRGTRDDRRPDQANFQSGECHSATASTAALQALASMMPTE